MAKVQRFEDLIVWQKARALARSIYAITRQQDFANDRGLAGQIQRASVSIMSNIAEGFERGSPAEFRRYLSIAKGSCAEVRAQLDVALDTSYLADGDFARIMAQAQEVGRLLAGLMTAVARKQRQQKE